MTAASIVGQKCSFWLKGLTDTDQQVIYNSLNTSSRFLADGHRPPTALPDLKRPRHKTGVNPLFTPCTAAGLMLLALTVRHLRLEHNVF